ncbi:hypothetical protein A1O1_09193 [Capronia coronata CBS 617.96]|uniref:Uncharacterized protein n=1 Tax=Capronia coronata CBS 617.96 TaxID=1182541 RepID=W9XP87_9EURO|nr:uncharacterized protein A1O1_09193 [Capronia coronata CBS 617.96]EXJ78791.1 hypothetical protein A1O1_09193 [Capronia coronata CBS 617.96]
MPFAKPKIPVYPRPVSPICADEIPVCKDTIVYYGGAEGFDEEDRHTETIATKRRIESYATAYLRGESLLISAAQLKGPFDNGWQNPWKRRKTATNIKHKTAQDTTCETVRKPAKLRTSSSAAPSKRHALPQTAAKAIAQPERSAQISSETTRRVISQHHSLGGGAGEVHPKTPGQPCSQENHKVEDWLRKNDSYMQPDFSQPSFSSPLAKKSPYSRTKEWESAPGEVGLPPMLDAIVQVAKSMRRSSHFGTSELVQDGQKNGACSQAGVIQPVTGTRTARKSTRSSSWHAAGPQEMNKYRSDTMDGFRAKGAVLETKSTSMPAASIPTFYASSDNRYDHLSSQPRPEISTLPPRHDPNQAVATKVVKAESRGGSNAESAVASSPLSLAPENTLPNELEAMPTYTKDQTNANTNTNTTNDLPSAQVLPQPTLRSRRSDMSSNGDMLELPRGHAVSQLIGVNTIEKSARPAEVEIEAKAVCAGLTRSRTPSRCEPADEEHVDAAEAPANDTLYSHSTVTSKVHTATEPSPEHDRSSLKKTSSICRVTKSRKKASFVASERSPGSSQGSIKSAMKVAKPTVLSQNRMNSKSALSQSLGCDERDGVEQTSPCNAMRAPNSSRMMAAPKGILKSSLSAKEEPPISSSKAASSCSKQDAQRAMRLDTMEKRSGLINDEDFDLDAAIDDLGSFLGVWDAEKEAARLSNASGQTHVAHESGI